MSEPLECLASYLVLSASAPLEELYASAPFRTLAIQTAIPHPLGVAPTLSSVVVVIAPATPIVGAVALGAELGLELSGYDPGFPVATLAYEWRRDGLPIAGATSATYVLVFADADAAITCEVTATNVQASAVAVSPAVMAGPLPTSFGITRPTRTADTIATTTGFALPLEYTVIVALDITSISANEVFFRCDLGADAGFAIQHIVSTTPDRLRMNWRKSDGSLGLSDLGYGVANAVITDVGPHFIWARRVTTITNHRPITDIIKSQAYINSAQQPTFVGGAGTAGPMTMAGSGGSVAFAILSGTHASQAYIGNLIDGDFSSVRRAADAVIAATGATLLAGSTTLVPDGEPLASGADLRSDGANLTGIPWVITPGTDRILGKS